MVEMTTHHTGARMSPEAGEGESFRDDDLLIPVNSSTKVQLNLNHGFLRVHEKEDVKLDANVIVYIQCFVLT